jgi:hypothetical protein
MIISVDLGHLFVLLAFIIVAGLVGYEYFRNYPYQAQQTKCFDCEKEVEDTLGHGYGYIGGTSKCFDCEAQILGSSINGRKIKRFGIYPELGSSTKCFSCENQYNPATAIYSDIQNVNQSNLNEVEYFQLR